MDVLCDNDNNIKTHSSYIQAMFIKNQTADQFEPAKLTERKNMLDEDISRVRFNGSDLSGFEYWRWLILDNGIIQSRQ